MCDARLIGFDKAPLPPGVGGTLAVQGVKRLIKFEYQDVHDACINQLSTQKGEALLYTTTTTIYYYRYTTTGSAPGKFKPEIISLETCPRPGSNLQ